MAIIPAHYLFTRAMKDFCSILLTDIKKLARKVKVVMGRYDLWLSDRERF